MLLTAGSTSGPGDAILVEEPRLPGGYRPRGSPIRPERHVAISITSIRTVIARAIARVVPRCPCCTASPAERACDTVRLRASSTTYSRLERIQPALEFLSQ